MPVGAEPARANGGRYTAPAGCAGAHEFDIMTRWLDAQHPYTAIGLLQPQLLALHAARDTAIAAATVEDTAPMVAVAAATLLPEVAVLTELAAVGVHGHAGRVRDRRCCTPLASWHPLRRFAQKLKPVRRNLIFATASSVMLGMTDKDPPRSCTTCSRPLVSKSGSARRTSG